MELFRKALYLGLGTVVLTKEKVEQIIDQAIAKGEMTREEGKDLVEEVMKKAEEQRHWLESRIQEETRRFVENAGFATKAELSALRARLDAIDLKLDRLLASQGQPQESAEGPSVESREF